MYDAPAAPSNGGIALALIGGETGFAMGTMSPAVGCEAARMQTGRGGGRPRTLQPDARVRRGVGRAARHAVAHLGDVVRRRQREGEVEGDRCEERVDAARNDAADDLRMR